MIYKCKNCGLNYSEKPDYCECGNNVFVVINSDVYTNSVFDAQETSLENIQEDLEAIYPKNTESENGDYYEDEETEEKKSNFSAILIFSFVCFALALCVSCFVVAKAFLYTNQNNVPKVSKAVKTNDYIPDVDVYWVDNDDTNSSISNVEIRKTAANDDIVPTVEKITPPQIKPKSETKSGANEAAKTEQKTKYVPKVQTPIVPDSTAKKSQIKEKTDTKKVVSDIKKEIVAKPDAKSKNTNSVNKNILSSEKQESIEKVEKIKIANNDETNDKNDKIVDKQNEIEAKKLLDYKTALRQRLFNYFPILNVYGVGSAQIGFSISSDGKLLNRRFVVQSDNKSLNDAMYHMLMQTPSFSPPPSAYKGEEIVLKMDFNNGHYSFSYVK